MISAGTPTLDISDCPDLGPVLFALASLKNGATFTGTDRLKVKESDRIQVMVDNLKAMGADIESTDDGMIIHGGKDLHGAIIDSHKDHRIAMSFAIASLLADGHMTILDKDCVNISFPSFYSDLNRLSGCSLQF